MQKTKTSSHTGSSTIRQITISSNFKFQKVEKLNQIVQEVGQAAHNEESGRQAKEGMSERVLDVLKQRIKTNYDKLYSNYSENKTKILKQIQTVETNMTSENTMNGKEEEVIKEKNRHDKLKTAVEEKQRKLKKLVDLRAQLLSKREEAGNTELVDQQREKIVLQIQQMEEGKHHNCILTEMLSQRKKVLLTLQERYTRLTTELSERRQKTQKLRVINDRKKQAIQKIEQEINREQQVEIPAKLAEELSAKIAIYEHREGYNNILKHEAILQEKRSQQTKQNVASKREEQRLQKTKKDREQRQQLEALHNLYAVKRMEEEKIKRLCGVESIQEVLNIEMGSDKPSLDHLREQIEQEIAKWQTENYNLQAELKDILTKGRLEAVQMTVEQAENQLYEAQRTKRLLQSEYQKMKRQQTQWLTLMQLINDGKVTQQSLTDFTNNFISYQQMALSGQADPREVKLQKQPRKWQRESKDSFCQQEE